MKIPNDTIHPLDVPTDWSTLSTADLVAVPRTQRRLNAYNRDTMLGLANALADRIEELERVLRTYR